MVDIYTPPVSPCQLLLLAKHSFPLHSQSEICFLNFGLANQQLQNRARIQGIKCVLEILLFDKQLSLSYTREARLSQKPMLIGKESTLIGFTMKLCYLTLAHSHLVLIHYFFQPYH